MPRPTSLPRPRPTPRATYRFELGPSVPAAEAEMSLRLAMIALEGLYGPAGVRLDARYAVDPAAGAIAVDASTDVGASLVRVFATLLAREFGDDAFAVARVDAGTVADLLPATAGEPVGV
jgi:hypothetical protein